MPERRGPSTDCEWTRRVPLVLDGLFGEADAINAEPALELVGSVWTVRVTWREREQPQAGIHRNKFEITSQLGPAQQWHHLLRTLTMDNVERRSAGARNWVRDRKGWVCVCIASCVVPTWLT